jgi:hypothetical protein
MRYLILAIAIAGMLVGVGSYRYGFSRGWIEYAADAYAIESYHDCADQLTDDEDADALAACWDKSRTDAAGLMASWDAASLRHKLTTPVPFWRQDIGEPRRLSRGQKTKLTTALRQVQP